MIDTTSEEKLRQMFKNRADAYLNTIDESVEQGMSEQCYIETLNEALNILDVSEVVCPNCGAKASILENGLFKCSNWDCGNFANWLLTVLVRYVATFKTMNYKLNKYFNMKQKTNKLAQFKQWILSIVVSRFYFCPTILKKVSKKHFLSLTLRSYGAGNQLKIGDKICSAYTVNYVNLNGTQSSKHSSDEVTLTLKMFVLKNNQLYELYKDTKQK